MALADRAQQVDTRSAFEKWLDGNTPANRATVLGWLQDVRIPASRVAKWVRDDDADDEFLGYPASVNTVTKWRSDHGIS